MAITLTTAARNAACDAVVDLCDGGSSDANGDLVIRTSGDVEVATLALSNPAFGAASSGTATASAISDDTSATGGTAANFILQDRDNAEVLEVRAAFEDNVSTTRVSHTITNDTCGQQVDGDTSGINHEYTCGSFDANGFSVTTNAAAGLDDLGYLAIKFATGISFGLVDYTVPTTGSVSITGLGFQPDFQFGVVGGGLTARNTPQRSNRALHILTKGPSGGYVASMQNEDSVSTTETSSAINTDRLISTTSSGDDAVWSDWSFTSDGMTQTLTTNPSSEMLGWAFFAGEAATSSEVSPSPLHQPDSTVQPIAASRLNGVLQ